MGAFDSVGWDRARAVAVLEAPRNFNALGVADRRVGSRRGRGEQAEVVNRVYYSSASVKEFRIRRGRRTVDVLAH